MSIATLRREAKALIDSFSGPQLRMASEFLAFVRTCRPDPATLDLLKIPGFEESSARGVKDIKAGRTKPGRKARADV